MASATVGGDLAHGYCLAAFQAALRSIAEAFGVVVWRLLRFHPATPVKPPEVSRTLTDRSTAAYERAEEVRGTRALNHRDHTIRCAKNGPRRRTTA